VSTYSLMLFLHFVFIIAAVAATAIAGLAALRLRCVETAADAMHWEELVRRVVPVFPVTAIGMIGTGAYMTSKVWSWTAPWVVTGIAGLFMIIFLGAGVESGRRRAARTELRTAGLSERAKRLLCDPVSWSAKVTTWTLVVSLFFVMTAKPSAATCAVALAIALACGVLGAVPFWARRGRTTDSAVRHQADWA
jgi:hypothetical protein